MTMTIRDSAISFEARKLRMNQTKEGWVLHLAVHPNDAPEELMRTYVGTRYAVVMVEIGDDEQPVDNPAKVEANRTVVSAVMLSKNLKFQQWAGVDTLDNPEAAASDLIKKECKIDSRKELATNDEARELFDQLRSRFLEEALGQ